MAAPAAVFRHFLPAPELRPYVCGYMLFTLEGKEPARTEERFFPDGSSETRFNSCDPLLNHMLPGGYPSITFNLGDPWTVHSERETRKLVRSWAMGATTRAAICDFGRGAAAFGVMFHAGRAQRFLGASAAALTNEFADLDALWGPEARRLESQIAGERHAPGKIRVLEKELLRRARSPRRKEESVSPIARWIERERGALTVSQLSAASGISRQQIARRFREHVGVSPKQFCRFVRFHAVVNHVYYHPRANWAEVAAEFGFYDQAHLIAEFKELTGLTPGQFFRPPSLPTAIAAD